MEGINVASVMASARPNEGQPAIFVIKFRSVLLTTVSLMVFSFVFCILWTLKYNQVGKNLSLIVRLVQSQIRFSPICFDKRIKIPLGNT